MQTSVGVPVKSQDTQPIPSPRKCLRRTRPKPLTLNQPQIHMDNEPLGFEAVCLGDINDTAISGATRKYSSYCLTFITLY